MTNKEEISSIIVLGETGTGKSSFCNNLCLNKKCQIGEGLNSETEKVNGINCEGIYSDIFIIDTPGLNDSNGPEQDERNIELMNDFIKKNPRIKGIIILLKFTDNRLTGSVKKSLKIFCNMFPMNNFWNHVIIVLSHFYANNNEEKQKRKTELIKHYKQEFITIMNQSKIEHPNFILPSSINIYFCELKNPNEETKTEISKAIEYLRSKEQMFKKIEERIENPKIINTTKIGNTTTEEYIIEKIITFTDFDNTQTESKKIMCFFQDGSNEYVLIAFDKNFNYLNKETITSGPNDDENYFESLKTVYVTYKPVILFMNCLRQKSPNFIYYFNYIEYLVNPLSYEATYYPNVTSPLISIKIYI